jgi:hypothetical protein
MLKTWAFIIFATLLGLVWLPTPTSANLVQNGSFEQVGSNLATDGYHICDNTTNTSCTSNLTSWSATCSSVGCSGTSTPGSVLLGGTGGSGWNSSMGLWGSVPNSPDGGNFIGIDGDSQYSNTIYQTITGLFPGMTYQLSFYQAAAQQQGITGNTTNQWKVTFGSSTWTSQVMNNQSQSYTPWTAQSVLFTATSTSQVLTFLAVGSPAGQPPISLLDGVTLNFVPEPSSIAVLLAGLFCLGLAARRMRPSAAKAG